MNKRRWISIFGAACLFLLAVMAMRAGNVRGCALPLLENTFNVSSSYGMRVHPLTGIRRMHYGVDLACPRGTPVHAVSGGSVVFAGRKGCYGEVLVISHPGDVMTLYAHLWRIAPGLRRGVLVRQGQTIGLVGASGCVTGSHLHFELWKAGQRVNPALMCAALRFHPALLTLKEVN